MIITPSELNKFLRALVVGLVVVGLLGPRELTGADDGNGVTSQQVADAIRRGVAYLRNSQSFYGRWKVGGHRGGGTALCVLALLNGGVSPEDPTVKRGLVALERVPNQATYVVSLKAQVYAAVGKEKYQGEIQKAADWLVKVQLANGMWNYGTRGRGDNSNTQFALLGLHEAANAGAKIPHTVWNRSRRHFLKTQQRGGGWSYTGEAPSYGSMTAAGVASLYICGQRLFAAGPKTFRNGAYPGCGKYVRNKAIAAGLGWLEKRFTVRTNPRKRKWLFYYLYALERVGMISGIRNFGTHDWYREGAEYLVKTQNQNGSWGREVYQTPFAILFLAKGNRPVLIRKVQWNGNWNRNLHDLENLTNFIGDKLGQHITWETTTLELPTSQLRTSPILFITGHEFPNFSQDQKERLGEFVMSGGTLLFEACCGSQGFRRGFRIFAEQLLPHYKLRPIDPNHAVFHSFYQIKDTYALEGIDVGCRTGVFFSPNALSCLWELEDVPVWSQKAFRLATNIAAYATGSQPLPDKLETVEVHVTKPGTPPVEIPRGAVRIARLIHNGDYNCDPMAMVNLAGLLRDKANVDVVSRGRHLRATDEAIYEYPVIFMQGHFAFELSDEEIDALRKYLQRGGFLFADACCGRKNFDTAFRKMIRKLFPDNPLTLLPRDHPVYTGQVGVPLGELRYRRILAQELKSRGTTYAPLEGVQIAGRTAVIYSKYDYSCALEGDNPYSCRGYIDPDGRKLGMNIILYGISY